MTAISSVEYFLQEGCIGILLYTISLPGTAPELMKLPPNVQLDSIAEQLLGLEPIEGLDDGFDLELPVNLIPGTVINGWEVRKEGAEDLEDSIEAQAEAIREKIKDAMKGVQADLKIALDDALQSSAWKWRSGGARDIYDTGNLLKSGRVVLSGTKLSVSYTAPYAAIVHDGGYIFPYGNKKARPIYLPGRPWISATLYGGGPVPRFNFNASLQRHLKM